MTAEEIVAALNNIVNTPTPRDRAKVLKEQSNLLLADESFGLLSKNIKKAQKKGDKEAVDVFEHVLWLLELTREKGLDAGLAYLEQVNVRRILQAFIESPSWVERIRQLKENKDVLLSNTAQQEMENNLEIDKQNQDAVEWIESAALMLNIARQKGIDQAVGWLQEQMLGWLSKMLAEGNLDFATEIINDLHAITEPGDLGTINIRVADVAIEHAGVAPGFNWIMNRIAEAIDQSPLRVDDVPLYLKLIEFLLTSEAEEEIEQAVTRLSSAIEDFKKTGYSFQGVYGTLGRSFLFRSKGDQQENRSRAREYLQRELAASNKEQDPQNWAVTHRLLGDAYKQAGDRKKAIFHLEQGITVEPLEPHGGYAQAALDLALLRIGVHGSDAFDAAIDDLNRAEPYAPENTTVWAWIHANLGDIYRQRQTGDPAENLKQAFDHTNRALGVFTRETHENEWAQMQHNLGTIYYADFRNDRADNIEKAIACYRQALEVHTKENYPQFYGLTNSSLGLAFTQRVLGKREGNLTDAFNCFKEAEATLDSEASKTWWAECMTGLGLIYMDLATPDRQQNLTQSAGYFDKARQAYVELGNKEREYGSLSNLAIVYNDLGEFDSEAYKKSIQYAQTALDATNRETNPYQWAIFNRNLAAVIVNQGAMTADSRSRALECVTNALEVFTPDSYLVEYRQSTSYLGHIHFISRSWEAALEAYQASIQAGEALLASAYTEPGRRAEVGETELAHVRAAYCLIQLQQLDEALVMVESGKTRLLSEMLAFSEINLANIPEELADRMQRARENVRSLEGQMRLALSLRIINTAELGTKLREARSQLDHVAAEIQLHNPNYGRRLTTFSEIVDQIPKGGALVAFIVTIHGTIVFVVEANAKKLQPSNIVGIPDFTSDTLDQLLDERQPQSWVALLQAAAEIQTPKQFKQWLDLQEHFMNGLWNNLIGPIYTQLSKLGIQPDSPVLFMPQGGLWLLALHAASRPVDGRQRVLADDYLIIYTPSVFVRMVCMSRYADVIAYPATLLAIIDPGGNLPYADQEASLISQHFRAHTLLPGKEATLDKVLGLAANTTYLHFACHGYHDWADTMLSGLELAPPDHLSLSEILAKLSLNTNRLVTLSACETGIIDLRGAPDEFVGLPTGFLLAGSTGVISTLWKVDDAATCLLVSALYKNHLEMHLSPPEALRAAQKWLRDLTIDGIHKFKHMDGDLIVQYYQEWIGDLSPEDRIFDNPFFWAGFTFVGA